MISLLLLVLTLPVRYAPPRPTVGDIIRIELPAVSGEVKGLPSACAEIVSVGDGEIRVRSFRPGKCRITFVVTEGGARQLYATEIEIKSVLQPKDDLRPAPLRPPVELPPNRTAYIAMGVAALVSALLWAAVLLRKEKPSERGVAVPLRDPFDAYREVIAKVADRDDRASAAELADATREFLSRIDPRFGRELTTRELLRAMRDAALETETMTAVRLLLGRGDVAKFSREASLPERPRDAALRLIERFKPAQEAKP